MCRRRCSRRPVASLWQPIETAPRDGTMVDLWLRMIAKAHVELLVDGRHCREHGFRVTHALWGPIGCDGGEGWQVWSEGEGEMLEEEDLHTIKVVTYWMPLPEPPEVFEEADATRT